MIRILDRPIIIVGAARSGSSLLHRLLSLHDRVAWLTRLCDRWPHNLRRNRAFMRLIDVPLLGPAARRRILPGECYPFWETHAPGFSRPMRDLVADDVTPRVAAKLPALLADTLTERRSRLLLKVTGWPRLGYLHTLFPDARFIHIVRDGRAVANSTLGVHFWRGWLGPQQWRFGPLSPDYDALWHAHDRSFVALAGIGWNVVQDAVLDATRAHPDISLHEVRYEALCADPEATVRALLTFCNLAPSERAMDALRRTPPMSTNDKWRTQLNPDQQAVLSAVTAVHRARLGYDEPQLLP